MTPAPVSSDRLAFLDGARALSALYVVVHHAWLTIYPDGNPEGFARILTGWMKFGTFGVTVFIVLSGYSLMLGPSRTGGRLARGSGDFFFRRFKRIVLPYWIALAVSLVLALTVLSTPTGTHWDVALPVTWPGVIAHLVLLQDFVFGPQINHVFWSVALEWHLYFLFPLLLLAFRRLNPLAVVAALAAITIPVSFAFTDSGVWAFKVFNFIACFAIGMLACRVSAEGGRLTILGRTITPRWNLLALALVVTTAAAALLTPGYSIVNPLLAAAAGCLLISLRGGSAAPVRRILEWRPLVAVGVVSYSLYLLHAPVEQLVYQYVLHPLGLGLTALPTLAALLVLGGALSIAVAFGFYRVAEAPFLPKKTRRAITREVESPDPEPAGPAR